MEPIKVVVRYLDGRVIKGFTQNFSPNKNRFHLHPAPQPSGELIEVLVEQLKAVFYVRDFAGNPLYNERKKFIEAEIPSGRKIEVTFVDGEVMVGTTLTYDPKRLGFYIFTADPKSNNIKAFVVNSAAKKVRFL